ncbi:hypothetical protein SADUNF_Sadunf18G0034400 [Salix dunnii]|uniref:Uncharacterized protein n=1 Tax=Salix dunnii TaxID=1413687 RepID=A0A835MLX7_9ROSI|nr:hypothetical protein SADUNF_Sadunf18G0034400 [Salix dunnii]
MTHEQPFLRGLQQLSMKIDVSRAFIENTCLRLADVFVDSMFEFVDQPLLPSQSNFAPVDELKEEAILVSGIEGKVPHDFPEGVYIRNESPRYRGAGCNGGGCHKTFHGTRSSFSCDLAKLSSTLATPMFLNIQGSTAQLLRITCLTKSTSLHLKLWILGCQWRLESAFYQPSKESPRYRVAGYNGGGCHKTFHGTRSSFRYNVVMDFPLLKVGPLIKYNKAEQELESCLAVGTQTQSSGQQIKYKAMLFKLFPRCLNINLFLGVPQYGGLAKLYFGEPADSKIILQGGQSEELIQVEYHKFEQITFCTGAAFVPKQGSHEEDDGWIMTFVHKFS